MTIELSENVINAIADAVVKKIQEPKTGRWIDIDYQSYTWQIKCPYCNHSRSMMSTQGIYPNYCENCGARMVESEDKE